MREGARSRRTESGTELSVSSPLPSEPADSQAPEIVTLYALNVPPSMVRLKIRHDFERNRNVENLDVINMLLHKNQQEFQETMNMWKQEVSGMGRVHSARIWRPPCASDSSTGDGRRKVWSSGGPCRGAACIHG